MFWRRQSTDEAEKNQGLVSGPTNGRTGRRPADSQQQGNGSATECVRVFVPECFGILSLVRHPQQHPSTTSARPSVWPRSHHESASPTVPPLKSILVLLGGALAAPPKTVRNFRCTVRTTEGVGQCAALHHDDAVLQYTGIQHSAALTVRSAVNPPYICIYAPFLLMGVLSGTLTIHSFISTWQLGNTRSTAAPLQFGSVYLLNQEVSMRNTAGSRRTRNRHFWLFFFSPTTWSGSTVMVHIIFVRVGTVGASG